MLRLALALCLGLSAGLSAFGGTTEPWLGGTSAWDSIPAWELNLGAEGHMGQGAPSGGPFLQAGLTDQLMLAGAWRWSADGSVNVGNALAQWREASFPDWRPALALSARLLTDAGGTRALPGLVAALEPWEHSMVLQIESDQGRPVFGGGYWSPFLISMLRLGLEIRSDPSTPNWLLFPQLLLLPPGDVALALGAFSDDRTHEIWTAALRFSVLLFPSP